MSNELEVIKNILYQHCDVKKETIITIKSRLIEDLALDSMGILSLTVELENHYEKVIPVDSFVPPKTVEEILSLIVKLREGQGYEYSA